MKNLFSKTCLGMVCLVLSFLFNHSDVFGQTWDIGGNTITSGSNDLGTDASSSQGIDIVTNGIERITVTANGDVGIGTTSPVAKLDVNGYAQFNGNIIMKPNTYINCNGAYANGNIKFHNGTNGYEMILNTGATNPMRIMSSVKMGGGSGQNAFLNSNGEEVFNFRATSGYYGYTGLRPVEFTKTLAFQNQTEPEIMGTTDLEIMFGANSVTSSVLTFSKGDQDGVSDELMRLTEGGRLGIGVTSPNQLLEVKGTGRFSEPGNQSEYLDIGHDGASSYINSGGAGNHLLINYPTNNEVHFGQVGLSPQMRVFIAGDLDVCDRVKATEVEVISSWCDYVFDEKYDLMSLKEVEAFIQQNHHLPKIPKASEVEDNGLEVGAMTRRMMEKIEELTLYVIDQENRMEAQQAQIEELKKENQQLSSLLKH